VQMQTMRRGGTERGAARAVDSRSGKAIVTPAARRKARRLGNMGNSIGLNHRGTENTENFED
jgi:hypothetical protein